MSKKKITAAELMAKLNADPEFVAKRAREEEERLKREAEYRRAEAPLVDELRAAGFQVQSAWDLVNTPGLVPRSSADPPGAPSPSLSRSGTGGHRACIGRS
jgi:hypothetical protein